MATPIPQNENAMDRQTIAQIQQEIDWWWLPHVAQAVLEQAMAIQQIPAPTFAETARAAYIETQFHNLGLESIATDERFNVFGLLRGQKPGPGLMISAHTDTVFPADTDLKIRNENNRLYGPGLGDNSLGVSGMLGLIEALSRAQITPPVDLWFAATSREEGLGDLGGMRFAYVRLKPQIKAVINLEGMLLGRVTHAGIAVKRLHITTQTEGGHSWSHFGNASAIHGLVNLGARITSIVPPTEPRTTYNIGLIEGGQSINSIAARADLWFDMRSEARETLAALEQQVRNQIDALSSDKLRFSVEVVSDRPSGAIAPQHPLVQLAVAALKQVDIEGILETGSTDGNIPLADGCPTVTIGITRGGNAHRLDEYIETAPIAVGIQQIILLVLAAGRWEA